MRRTRNALIPAALIATLAGAAGAQFVAATTVDPQPEQRGAGLQSITHVEDGTRTELRIENGVIVLARVDGEDWPKERVERRAGRVLLLDADGKTVRTLQLPDPPPVVARVITRWDDNGRAAPTPPAAPAPPSAPRVMLGITYSDPGEALRAHLGLGDKPAMQVDSTVENLPAAKAGLRRHDVIVSINGSEGASAEILRAALADAEPGDTLELTVRRAGETRSVRAELAAYDAAALGVPRAPQPPATWIGGRFDPDLGEIDRELESLKRRYAEDPDNASVLERIQALTTERAKRIARTMQEHARGMAAEVTDEGFRLRFRSEGEPERIGEDFRRYAEQIERIAEDMSRDLNRRVLELRDGRLFIRSADEVNKRVEEVQQELAERAPVVRARVEDRIRLMEERMEHIERSFESRIDRLTALLERMADRLDQGDGPARDEKNP